MFSFALEGLVGLRHCALGCLLGVGRGPSDLSHTDHETSHQLLNQA